MNNTEDNDDLITIDSEDIDSPKEPSDDLNNIIKPTLKGLRDLNCEYKGFLYAGLMIVNGDPFLIEYNVRMGDPECQTLLPKKEQEVEAELLVALLEPQ